MTLNGYGGIIVLDAGTSPEAHPAPIQFERDDMIGLCHLEYGDFIPQDTLLYARKEDPTLEECDVFSDLGEGARVVENSALKSAKRFLDLQKIPEERRPFVKQLLDGKTIEEVAKAAAMKPRTLRKFLLGIV